MNTMDFISKSFTDEAALQNIDAVIQNVHGQLVKLEGEISVEIRKSRSLNLHLSDIRTVIGGLMDRLASIKAKSQELQGTPQPCKAIYQATHNLVRSLDALFWLKQLIETVERLGTMQELHQYGRIPELFHAVAAIVPFFTNYLDMPIVAKLTQRIEDMRAEIKEDVLLEFSSTFGKVEDDDLMVAHLAESAEVANSLGDAAIDELEAWYCKKTMAVCQEMHGAGDGGEGGEAEEQAEAGGESKRAEGAAQALSSVLPRFEWLKETLDGYYFSYAKIFPAQWQVAQALASQFCDVHRKLLQQLVVQAREEEVGDVMEAAKQLEQELTSRFSDAVGVDVTSLTTTRRSATLQPKWEGIMSVVLEPYAPKTSYKDVDVPLDEVSGSEEQGGRSKQAQELSETDTNNVLVLVPRMAESGVVNDDVKPEQWEINVQHLQLAAFESLLMCMRTQEAASEGELQRVASESVRVQMSVSRRQCKKLQMHLDIETPSSQVDISTMNLATKSTSLANMNNMQLEPYYHYRWLAIIVKRMDNFDDDAAAFTEWYQRQQSVFLSALFWTAANAGFSDCGGVELADAPSKISLADAHYKMRIKFDRLLDAITQPTVDAAAVSQCALNVEENLQRMYTQIDQLTLDTKATSHTLSYPYPLNMQMFSTLILCCFDTENMGEMLPYVEDHFELYKFCLPFWGITELMYKVCVVHCHFLVYRTCYESNALLHLEMTVSQMQREFVDHKRGQQEAQYEAVVCGAATDALHRRLMDYHDNFHPEGDGPGCVRGEFDVYVALKYAGTIKDNKEMAANREKECIQFIKSSVMRYFQRLSAAKGGDDLESDDDDRGELASIIDLAQYIRDGAMATVMAISSQFKPYYAMCNQASVSELLAGLRGDVDEALKSMKNMDRDTPSLIEAVRQVQADVYDMGMQEVIKDVKLMLPFEPLLEKELNDQQVKFDDMLQRCQALENWEPIEDQLVTSGVIDLFSMIAQSVPMVIDFIVQTTSADALDSLQMNVDGLVMKYANECRNAGTRPPIVPAKKGKRGKLGRTNSRSNMSAIVDEPERLDSQTLGELACRINNLQFAHDRVEELAGQLQADMEGEDMYFMGGLMTLEGCRDELCKYLGAKLVFWDLKGVLYGGVYKPSASVSRLDAVFDELDDSMSELHETVHPEVFPLVVRAIFECVVEALEHVLTSEGDGTRLLSASDSAIFLEDLDELKEFFIARDDEGEVQGIAQEDAELITEQLQEIITGQQFIQ